MIVKLLTEHHMEFLSLKGGCRGSSESTHVEMTHCWKSRALAHFIMLCQYPILKAACGTGQLKCYVIVIPWVVRLYVEIIHEL